MANLNKVQLIGHIGADPELKITNTNQVPVVNLRIATNEGWTDNNGQKHENTTWHTVVCFRGLAQTVAQYMKKGRQVYIEGRLQSREYMGQVKDAAGNVIMMTNGQPLLVKKYTTEIVAFNVQFLGSNPMNAYNQGMQAAMLGNGNTAIPAAAPNAVVAAPTAPAPGTVNATFIQPTAPAAPAAPVAPTNPATTQVVVPGV